MLVTYIFPGPSERLLLKTNEKTKWEGKIFYSHTRINKLQHTGHFYRVNSYR